MNEIEKSWIDEIRKLHNEIWSSLKSSLEKAIRIGQILNEQKENLEHGKFTAWVKDNLPFTDRTARNYMRLYRERDRFKTETVSDLTEAYGRLVEHKSLEEKTPTPPIMLKGHGGRKFEYTEEVKKSIFDSDVEMVMYLLVGLKEGEWHSSDEIYEVLEALFDCREKAIGVPNTLTKDLFHIYKFSAINRAEEIAIKRALRALENDPDWACPKMYTFVGLAKDTVCHRCFRREQCKDDDYKSL